MQLEGKVALITGSGAGIGRAIALRFAREGARVMVNDINPGETTLKMIRDIGGQAAFVLADVSRASEAEGMVKATIQTFGKIDILVNNAGIWLGKLLVDVTEGEWDRLIDTNLKGVFLASKYAIPEMASRGGGVIINMSSVAGLVGSMMATTYCASKGGVLLLTKAMAVELRSQNIRVNALCPSLIETDMGRQVLRDMGGSATGTPNPRLMGDPQAVANAALFLASDESVPITGHGLVVGTAGAMPQ